MFAKCHYNNRLTDGCATIHHSFKLSMQGKANNGATIYIKKQMSLKFDLRI